MLEGNNKNGENISSDSTKKTEGNPKQGCGCLIVILIVIIAIGFGVYKHNVTKKQKAEAVKQEQIAKQKQAVQEKKEEEAEKNTQVSEQKSNIQNVKLDPLFKLSQIKGKTPAEINNIIGNPDAQRNDKWEYADTHEETDAVVEIFHKKQFDIELWFIDGKAEQLSLEPKVQIPSNQISDVLKIFSLGFTNPTSATENGMTWNNELGVYEFSTNFNNGKVSDIVIVLDEKYKF